MTSVMSKWCASCIILRLEKEKFESWKKLHVISCQHLQVMMTNLLQKHWEWQEDRIPMLRHGHQDGALVAKIMESHNTHGWIISALLREMAGLEVQAMFECVESNFLFNRCLRQGSAEAPGLWQNVATQFLTNVEENCTKKREGILLDLEGQRAHHICSFRWADNFWILSNSKIHLE